MIIKGSDDMLCVIKNALKSVSIAAILATFTGCISLDEMERQLAEKEQLEEQAKSVRLVSESQAAGCRYVDQASASARLSPWGGGVSKMEEDAKQKLRIEASKRGADSMRVVDRVYDKGRGGADSTNLMLVADLFYCRGGVPNSATHSQASEHSSNRIASPNASEQIREAQERLSTFGYYSGAIDGLYGPDTRSAITAFQKNNGLEQSGQLDAATARKLQISSVD